MNFKANNKEYVISEVLRGQVKSGWEEMLKPAKDRKLEINLFPSIGFITKCERELDKYGISLLDKNILEIGSAYGERAYLMAKYEGVTVHGIDVDEYTANQSPDLNAWNPNDVKLIHEKLEDVRSDLSDKFSIIKDKITFQTIGIEDYETFFPHDLIVSWDTLEHIINLPKAFKRMSEALRKGGICYHEYNPFFSANGGHSLCTLDFLYGHCLLSPQDFERYIKEIRPNEEKIDLNFYHKCLNRASRADIRELVKNDFEILEFEGTSYFGKDTEKWKKDLEENVLPTVREHYPTVTIDDLLCDSVHIILRKL